MKNNGINLDLTNKIKIDIYSHAEEKLFLDILVKKDLEYRRLAGEYVIYLEEIRDYIDLDNLDNYEEIVNFLKDKSSLDDIDEDLKKYMKQKFEYIDNIYSNKKEGEIINLELVKFFFPILGLNRKKEINNKILESIFKLNYIYKNQNFLGNVIFDRVKNTKIDSSKLKLGKIDLEGLQEKRYEWKSYFKKKIFKITKQSKLSDFKGKFLLIPFLIPKYDKDNNIVWNLLTIKFKDKIDLKIEEENLDLVKIFENHIIVDKNEFIEDEINYFFRKTDILCDYRYFDKSMLP